MKMNHTSALAGFALLFGFGCGARTILSDRTGLEDDGGAVAISDDGAITGFSSSSSSGSGGTGGVAVGGPTPPTGAGSSSGGSSGGIDAGGGSGSGGIARQISCGNVACTVGMQQCCIAAAGGRGGMLRCSPTGQCPGNTTVLACSGSASCAPGQVCCLGGGGGGMTSNCAAMCGRGGGGGAAVRQLCASNAECPARQVCQPTGTGFSACVPVPILDAGGPG